jgi:tRNA pseudouridine38-40 synthase
MLDIAKPITPFRLMEALNAQLRPAPVAILDCVRDRGRRLARALSCIGRAYEYRIVNRRAPLTWDKGLSWQVARRSTPGDARGGAATDRAHDFTTFRSAHCQSQSPVKTLDRLDVSPTATLIIEAAARSFLHHQVRSMVGCLALVGYGKWSRAI